ncbi:MAG: HAMP domain-containing histidine kinase [Spirochaetales bacterium]|nr:HAMP domain-containing histidine kinase [Spirochaetales bacterium]
MKLKMKFMLLSLGATIVPFFFLGIIMALQLGFNIFGDSFEQNIAVVRSLQADLPEIIKSKEYERLRTLETFLSTAVIDKDSRVLYSNIPIIAKGSIAATENLAGLLSLHDHSRDILFLPYNFEGEQGTIITVLASPVLSFQNHFRFFFLLPLVAIFLFTAGMSVMIIRSINQSILFLSKATKKVAEGNLDFSLQTKGNDEFTSLSRSFEQMRRQLKEEFSRRSRFLMGVSHDLKTPLASITGYLEALSDGMAKTPQQQEKFISIMKEKSGILDQRISHLIEYVKMETGQWRLSLEKVNAAKFLADIAACYKDEAEIVKYEFAMYADISPETCINMDKDLIVRVIENLVHNAVRYSGEHKNVVLKAETDEQTKTLCLGIMNKGPGIKPEELELVFEPFYRTDSTRNQKGFGLGLASVRAIIDAHNWSISCTSVPGKETIFTIQIPVII